MKYVKRVCIVVAIRIDKQSYKFCDFILTQGNLHGWTGKLLHISVYMFPIFIWLS